jgi:S1-C subfamily serine protease
MATELGALVALSNDIAGTVERVAESVVAVEARSRIGSSGFFVRPNLVLTADHTLETDEVEVVRAGGATERATIAGRDPSTDLALLRVEREGAPLAFAAAESLRTGAIAIAVARDDDGDVAATLGVVSAAGAAWRTWHGGEIDRFIRPDLSFYPRFSGSPLVDAAGRALGLNTGGLSRRQVLTVPGSTIERIVETLLARGGRIPRGYLGVALHGVEGGAIVLGVEPNGPAARGALLVGDVITAIGGVPIEDADDVHAQLRSGTAGTELEIDVVRAGAPLRLRVVAGERPQ